MCVLSGLREEDNSDRPDEYVVTLLGKDGHLSEVRKISIVIEHMLI